MLPPVVLVDCLTLLVSNVLLANESELQSLGGIAAIESRMQAEVDDLIRVAENHETHLIVVSGEVGMGLVPETALGRLFRDMLGMSNQRIAARATSTYFMLAGLPINASSLACSVQKAAEELGCNQKSATSNEIIVSKQMHFPIAHVSPLDRVRQKGAAFAKIFIRRNYRRQQD